MYCTASRLTARNADTAKAWDRLLPLSYAILILLWVTYSDPEG